MAGFQFVSPDIAVDIGTDNTRVYVKDKGIVVNEPSVVITRGESAVVLFRGGSSTQQAVETLLTRRGAREVEMLVDLRMNPRTPCTLEARERMADTRFVTYCKATSREKDLQKLYRKNIARTVYYAKNLFRIQVDAVSQFGESGNWLNFPPEHFSIREWSVASAEYRLEMVPAYAKGYADFDEAVQLPRMREAVERTRNMEEPEAISAAALTEKPIS